MLPARHRLRRPADFDATVRCGRRAAKSDIVIYVRRVSPGDTQDPDAAPRGPKVGLIVAKSVGTAVQRHAVSRRLRHVARDVLDELDTTTQMVIRALPGSAQVSSAALRAQLRAGLRKLRSSGAAR